MLEPALTTAPTNCESGQLVRCCEFVAFGSARPNNHGRIILQRVSVSTAKSVLLEDRPGRSTTGVILQQMSPSTTKSGLLESVRFYMILYILRSYMHFYS